MVAKLVVATLMVMPFRVLAIYVCLLHH